MLIHNISILHTLCSEPIIEAAVVIEEGVITWLGEQNYLPPQYERLPALDAQGGAVVPGFIDCHTHLVFAGSRVKEFALRSKGASYSEIMAAGGGIRTTMQAVRKATEKELIELALPRLKRIVSRGVTTLEAKTGYGLDVENEVKMLRVLQQLDACQPVDIMTTFMGAHALPPEFESRPSEYVELVIHEMLPRMSQANFADVFVEKGAFTAEQGQRILEAAQALGLRLRVHAEQLSHSGGTQLACKVGALSASHLEYVTVEDIRSMKSSGVVAEVLPIAQEYLGMKQLAPMREFLEAGVKVAIATDFNPGSAMCDDILLAARLAITRCGMNCEEALLGITRHAALALGRSDIGELSLGALGDLVILASKAYEAIFYDWSTEGIRYVIKKGHVVAHPLGGRGIEH